MFKNSKYISYFIIKLKISFFHTVFRTTCFVYYLSINYFITNIKQKIFKKCFCLLFKLIKKFLKNFVYKLLITFLTYRTKMFKNLKVLEVKQVYYSY